LQLRLVTMGEEDSLEPVELERLRLGNPAARGLPLLRALAVGVTATVVLPYSSNHKLMIEVAP
ncbi:MAG TPA: 3-oxoacyl-ACP synthase, partial [Candidatus Competibacteraceae bacterium]|nr:3-oxoacyl-ACP synthase [Candidatus Competibacteraceae bacterium]